MKPEPLPDYDLRECEDAANEVRRIAMQLPLLLGKILICTAVFTLSVTCEFSLSYGVIFDLLGPLPGEPWSATPAIVSFSGLICILAFYLYTKSKAHSLPSRVVSTGAGYIALGYVLFMGLMLARLLYMNSGGMQEVTSGGLLDEVSTPSGTGLVSWLFDALSAPFALVFGCLFVCNLYVADAMLGHLVKKVPEFTMLRALQAEARLLMDAVHAGERELRELENKRASVLRRLEPAASMEHASEIAAMVEQARAPLEAQIIQLKLRKKPLPSVLHLDGGPEVNVIEFEKRVNALRGDAKTIHAAFRGEEDGRKKT
jgi:hypothetical protein